MGDTRPPAGTGVNPVLNTGVRGGAPADPIAGDRQHQGSGQDRMTTGQFDREWDGRRKPVQGDLNARAERVDQMIDNNSIVGGQTIPDRGNTVFSQWPSRLVGPHPYDQEAHLRSQFIEDKNGIPHVPGQGIAIVDDKYFRYQDDKRKMLQQADFEAWLMSQVDFSSPEKVKYWKEEFPEMFAERERLWENQIDIQKQYAKINMRGAQGLNDWMLLYMIQRGLIQLPTGPLWQPSSVIKTDFERGLFSWKNFLPHKKTSGLDSYVGRVNFADPTSGQAGRSSFVPGMTGVTGAPVLGRNDLSGMWSQIRGGVGTTGGAPQTTTRP